MLIRDEEIAVARVGNRTVGCVRIWSHPSKEYLAGW
jgi:hypothetical protein